MKRRLVSPGEEVAEVEEFMPAEGTYEEDGKIMAALFGELQLDHDEKTAKVVANNPMVTLKNGDVVYCAITDVRTSMAMCDLVAVEGKERNITGDTSATVHISKVSSEYTQDVGREFRPGDIVRAKVIQVRPSVQLTTQDQHFGVIKALCKRCRAPLKKQGKSLRCEACDRSEGRKTANDYGEVEF